MGNDLGRIDPRATSRPFFSDDTLRHVENCDKPVQSCEECSHYFQAIRDYERDRGRDPGPV